MDTLKGKKILVTGGNGYLGKNLVSALVKNDCELYILDKTSSGCPNEIIADLTDQEQIKSIVLDLKPNLIYHLAANLNRDRDFLNHDTVMNINYFGTLNLLNALKNVDYDNFIFTSSSEVYGANDVPFHEKMMPLPASPYSLSKACAEMAIQTFSELNAKKFTILRLFNFFGKQMPDNFFIPQLVNSLKTGEFFKMTKGEQSRDFLYVSDVIKAMILTATHTNALNQTFNVCSGVSITLKELVCMVKELTHSECSIQFGALPYRENEIWNMVGDPAKIKALLDFSPDYTIKEAISELILN